MDGFPPALQSGVLPISSHPPPSPPLPSQQGNFPRVAPVLRGRVPGGGEKEREREVEIGRQAGRMYRGQTSSSTVLVARGGLVQGAALHEFGSLSFWSAGGEPSMLLRENGCSGTLAACQ